MDTAWKIVLEPVGENPKDDPEIEDGEMGRNESALVLYLMFGNGGAKQEVSRVGFVRRNSANAEVEFRDQLDAEMDKARAALEAITAMTENAGTLQ